MTEVKEIDVFDEARLVWHINNELGCEPDDEDDGVNRFFKSAEIRRYGKTCLVVKLTDSDGTIYTTDDELDLISAVGRVEFYKIHLLVDALKSIRSQYSYELGKMFEGVEQWGYTI